MKGRTQRKQKQKFIGILRPEDRHKSVAQSRGRVVWGRLRAAIPMVYLVQERNALGEKCTVVTEDRQRMVGCFYHSMVTAEHIQEMVKEWIHTV